MRITKDNLEEFRHQAAIDEAEARAMTKELQAEAPDVFGKYITVREMCQLTGADPWNVYYSLNLEGPDQLKGIRHGLWFVHVDAAIAYADKLKARRLRRAASLAKAAEALERKNRKRLDKAKKVAAKLDKQEGKQEKVESLPEGYTTVGGAAQELGVSQKMASVILREVEKQRFGIRKLVPLSDVQRLRAERIARLEQAPHDRRYRSQAGGRSSHQ